jgi:hypothetical protein
MAAHDCGLRCPQPQIKRSLLSRPIPSRPFERTPTRNRIGRCGGSISGRDIHITVEECLMTISARNYCALALVLAALPLKAQPQQLPELLTPVDQSISDKFADRSNFFLRQTLYSAKPGRYRIVKVASDLLAKDGVAFMITPFPATLPTAQATASEQIKVLEQGQVTLQASELASTASYGETKFWKGRLLKPAVTLGTMNGRSMDAAALDRVNSISLTVRTETRDVLPALRRELLAHPDKSIPMLSNDLTGRGTLNSTAVMKIRVRTVSGEWFSPVLRSFVHIAPIEEDPRYHVVYEEDMAKRIQGKDAAARADAANKFSGALQREREQFEKAQVLQ